MFIFLYIMFLFLHKIYTSPALHLMVRADTPNVTATASTVATTPSPVGGSTTSTTTNTTASSGNVTQLANNTLSTAQPTGNATVSLPSGNATLSLPSGNKTSANGKDSATVASSNGTKTQGGSAGGHTGTFSWSSVLGEAEVSKENSEECPHGILQCVCDAMADFVYGSSEEKGDDDDDDDNGWKPMGIFYWDLTQEVFHQLMSQNTVKIEIYFKTLKIKWE
uniref:Uncharacterized protein n=1 Tax=Cacopsylla melanoneura TaxID=428564 RepID=A0A8D8WUN5_9HEMI